MSYLGRGLEQVDNISKLDNITFNGGTTYALTKDSAAFTPISSNALLVSIDGVIQQGNFSVSGSNIVFNFSPTGSNTCDFIMHYGTGVAFTPADSSITKDKTNFVSTSSAAGLQIKGDGTTDGTLQLNCSQNSHGVKIASPAHSAGQSYTLTLPTTSPASNKMLQTDGSGNLSFVDAPSGAHVLLNDTYINSSTASITYSSSLINDTYEQYIITGSGIRCNSNAKGNIRVYLSDDNGSSYYTGGGNYTRAIQVGQTGASGNTLINRFGDDDAISITGHAYDFGGDGNAGATANFVLRCYNLRNLDTNTAVNRYFQVQAAHDDRDSTHNVCIEGAFFFMANTNEINNIKIEMHNSNTFGQGEFRLYGVA